MLPDQWIIVKMEESWRELLVVPKNRRKVVGLEARRRRKRRRGVSWLIRVIRIMWIIVS
jgi:hypothetical protein